MGRVCKFCGKRINTSGTENCTECTRYCMSKCQTALNTSTSWHSEPCVSCKHNPYAIQHKWDGTKWVKESFFVDGKEVTKAEAEEVEKENQKHLNSGDLNEMLNIKPIMTSNFVEEVAAVRKKVLLG